MAELTHFDREGRARMVDVGRKEDTQREAIARGLIYMQPETLQRILNQEIEKGNVFAVARVAAIMATKQTANLIPMCHPLMLTGVDVFFIPQPEEHAVAIEARVRTTGKTGVEMEALTAVSVAALTIYDMCKAIDRWMVIDQIRLVKKSGGKSGTVIREGEQFDGENNSSMC